LWYCDVLTGIEEREEQKCQERVRTTNIENNKKEGERKRGRMVIQQKYLWGKV